MTKELFADREKIERIIADNQKDPRISNICAEYWIGPIEVILFTKPYPRLSKGDRKKKFKDNLEEACSFFINENEAIVYGYAVLNIVGGYVINGYLFQHNGGYPFIYAYKLSRKSDEWEISSSIKYFGSNVSIDITDLLTL